MELALGPKAQYQIHKKNGLNQGTRMDQRRVNVSQQILPCRTSLSRLASLLSSSLSINQPASYSPNTFRDKSQRTFSLISLTDFITTSFIKYFTKFPTFTRTLILCSLRPKSIRPTEECLLGGTSTKDSAYLGFIYTSVIEWKPSRLTMPARKLRSNFGERVVCVLEVAISSKAPQMRYWMGRSEWFQMTPVLLPMEDLQEWNYAMV